MQLATFWRTNPTGLRQTFLMTFFLVIYNLYRATICLGFFKSSLSFYFICYIIDFCLSFRIFLCYLRIPLVTKLRLCFDAYVKLPFISVYPFQLLSHYPCVCLIFLTHRNPVSNTSWNSNYLVKS